MSLRARRGERPAAMRLGRAKSWSLGASAASAGAPISSNPFTTAEFRRQWELGWAETVQQGLTADCSSAALWSGCCDLGGEGG